MEYRYNYCEKKDPISVSFINDQVYAKIFLDSKFHRLDIQVENKNKYNRKKINLSYYLNEIIKFLYENDYIVPYGKEYMDLFNIDNVKRIRLKGLKIEDEDIKVLSRFKNAYHLDLFHK